MKKIVVGICVFFVGMTTSYGEASTRFLTLTIKSDKSEYVVGEKVNLEAVINNSGKQAVKIYSPDYWGVSEIVVTDLQANKIKPNGIKIERAFFETFMAIPSGEKRAHIFKNLQWFDCSGARGFINDAQLKPGTYSISLTVTNPPRCQSGQYLNTSLSGDLTSNRITIKVISQKTQDISLHLQEGFFGKRVIVSVNARVIFDGTPETDPRLGQAATTNFDTNSRYVDLNIQIPSDGINSTTIVDLNQAKGIGVSIRQGKVSIVQKDYFGYD